MPSRAAPQRARLERFREAFEGLGVDAALVTGAPNRRWLSGFTGSAGSLVITPSEALLLTDGRYVEQAALEAPGFEIVRTRQIGPPLKEAASRLGLRRIAVEEAHMSWREARILQGEVAPLELVPFEGLIEGMRRVKSPEEIALIERAQTIADEALEAVLPLIRPGAKEAELALEIEYSMRRLGAQGAAFPTIVASGPRTSLPHASPTDRALEEGDLLTVDWGAVVDGYCSDSTRTYFVARAPEAKRVMVETVLRAKAAAMEVAKPGMAAGEVDAAARRVIEEAGFPPEAFPHSLGHGVGLEVHEGPALGQRRTDVLEPGMVVTFEPGIYVPGTGGVRIEDLAVVEADGIRPLTRLTSALQVLGG